MGIRRLHSQKPTWRTCSAHVYANPAPRRNRSRVGLLKAFVERGIVRLPHPISLLKFRKLQMVPLKKQPPPADLINPSALFVICIAARIKHDSVTGLQRH